MSETTDVYQTGDYRKALKSRIDEIQGKQPGFTLKRLATKIPIQYTYLSKAMNNAKVHLSEDHLFTVCEQLGFQAEERDFILLKRSYETASNPDRKKYLSKAIDASLKKRNLNVEMKEFDSKNQAQEVQYLFDPLCIIVQVALSREIFQKNPTLLCEKLGIGISELKSILQKLMRAEIIELEEGSPLKVKSKPKPSIHYGQDHPFMRVHQSLLKTTMASQLLRCPEDAKQSVLVTFTMDEPSFQKMRERFNVFLKDVEQIASKARHTQVYQMSFDLFRWL